MESKKVTKRTPLPTIDVDLIEQNELDFELYEDPGANARYIDRILANDRARFHALSLVNKTYPRIAVAITEMWGTQELHEYLHKILVLDTEGRQGFPDRVGKALMYIHMFHQAKFEFEGLPEEAAFFRDVW